MTTDDPADGGEGGLDSVWRWSLATFRDRTASDAPTPGGGSAAMVSATIGLGLVLMALRVTARKAGDPEKLTPVVASADGLLAELSAHADADIAAFEGYMAALRLPKASEEEKAARKAALAQAGEAGTETLLNAAQSALEALDLTDQAARLAQANILSDVGAGGAILHGAIMAVLFTVDINLPGIKDPELRTEYAGSRAHLGEAAARRYEAIRQTLAGRQA
ncbi:MAG: methenyltetrahydrofolate cyclohydrolase [Alphaproteobacteria bacterium]|jgi:formiminotetrahydrofolate cyclodeaminase|nr:methenyltetrahydrofolate cyclohydrolase [Alphaproteobacteria bacterium]